ncbi:hypothetical protein NDU88_004898 [Pleurodeles waltl]|uniref:Uncharacterized protein n=1 Tax=Pleurodeles waltl TaxID=8319 RepID=A0AAV7UGH5_PLEWA|nr:hypothetical protein NDU88_004898 [Pleurodeles waltl]
MPSRRASAGKRKGRDPELSQLLRLVLERLGNDDSDCSDMLLDSEDTGANSSRPRRSHVGSRAAFPVKRRNKGKAPASAPDKETSTLAVSPPGQVILPEIPVPALCAQPEPHVTSEGASTTPGLGVADVLASIRQSLASLTPVAVPGVPTAPVLVVPMPVAMPLAPPTPQVPKQQAQKPELAISLIYYANKILKAQHTYGGSAWLEYDNDFRWAKVEDPSIGWDQTEDLSEILALEPESHSVSGTSLPEDEAFRGPKTCNHYTEQCGGLPYHRKRFGNHPKVPCRTCHELSSQTALNPPGISRTFPQRAELRE